MHKPNDAATLLPIAAAVLFLPPFILVFAAPVLVAGIPLIVVYVFGAWAFVVLCAWLVARHCTDEPDAVNTSFDTRGDDRGAV